MLENLTREKAMLSAPTDHKLAISQSNEVYRRISRTGKRTTDFYYKISIANNLYLLDLIAYYVRIGNQ